MIMYAVVMTNTSIFNLKKNFDQNEGQNMAYFALPKYY